MTTEIEPKLLTTRLNNFEEFIPLALRSESVPSEIKTNATVFIAAIAASIASSEIMDGFKKQIFYGKTEKLLTRTTHYTKILDDSVKILSQPFDEDSLSDSINMNPRLLHGLLGTFTEAGELVSILYDVVSGREIDKVGIREEFSDIAWYAAVVYDELELDYYQGLTNVINKLFVRYPEKFDSFLADNRNLEEERKQLEQT